MDILAKKAKPDENGARIAELDEMSYRQKLWAHRPLTDFWRVGRGYAKRLEAAGLYTMGDIAICSEKDEDYLYRLFGINAELLIDHAWGWEPCEIKEIREYRPTTNSFSSGQVLKEPYDFEQAKIVALEMAEEVSLGLLSKKMVTNQVILTVGYDKVSSANYDGEKMKDFYGREVPRHAHGTYNLERYTASSKLISEAVAKIFDDKVNPKLKIRRITIDVNRVKLEKDAGKELRQLGLFDQPLDESLFRKEKRTEEAILSIKRKYGRNAILKGINFEKGATGRERNAQIGGHRK